MYSRFCVNCGKKTDKLINGLCLECYNKLEKKKIEKNINIKICSSCGSINYKNKWMEPQLFLQKIEKKYGEILQKTKHTIITRKYIININYRKELCPVCKEYYNARSYNYVIQIRGEKSKINKILPIFSSSIIKKIEETKNGVDIYMKSHQKEIRKLLSNVNYQEIKISRKVIGFDHQKGKKKFRVYILVKI